MQVTTFDGSGRIIRWMEMPEWQDALANLQPGEMATPGRYDPAGFYVSRHDPADPSRTAVILPLPPQPGPWAVFDYAAGVWIDPRTPDDRAAELAARRRAASLSKSDLLIRLVLAEILSETEADEAAGGIIPASMAAMMAGLPADAQMAARIKWRADAQIGRTHPVIVSAAYALGVSDETLDGIFGVEAP